MLPGIKQQITREDNRKMTEKAHFLQLYLMPMALTLWLMLTKIYKKYLITVSICIGNCINMEFTLVNGVN